MTYSIEEAKAFVIKAGLELSEAGLVARTWGNISARISDHQFVITPSGRAYETLTPADLVVVNIEDGSYEGNVKPSGEKGVHAAVYQMRPQMNFVIHTHQNYASALSILGEKIIVKEDDDRLLLSDAIPCADYGMYATQKLVDAIKFQMQENERSKAVLMRYHGVVCMGKDYEEAFSTAYTLEKVCQKEYESRCGMHAESEAEAGAGMPAQAENPIGAGMPVQEEIPIEAGIPAKTEIPAPYEIDDALKGILEKRDHVKAVNCVQTPFILAVSSLGKKQRPYLDDLAQIAGTDINCIKADANTSELLKALEKRNAVFIEGVGAICTGIDESEAQAVAIVLEKACMASYLAHKMQEVKMGKIPPLPWFSAWKDRKGYVSHYSKLK